jgi:hypothetical protein
MIVRLVCAGNEGLVASHHHWMASRTVLWDACPLAVPVPGCYKCHRERQGHCDLPGLVSLGSVSCAEAGLKFSPVGEGLGPMYS